MQEQKTMNETTANLLEAFKNYVWVEPQTIFYRAYYNEAGWVTCYTMEDLPGNYVDIDAETYVLGPAHARVINGQVVVVPRPVTVYKLAPHASTGTPCDPRDVCVVVRADQPHTLWSTKSSELN